MPTVQAGNAGGHMRVPVFWRRFLCTVAIGKAAVAGASLALALLGVLGMASAITAHDAILEFQKEYVNYFAAAGGVVGGVIGWVWNNLLK